MTTENDKLLTGLFKNRNDMESAYNSALGHGYKPEDINIVMSDETRNKYFLNKDVKAELGDKSMEGMAVGGALGALWAQLSGLSQPLVRHCDSWLRNCYCGFKLRQA